MLNVRDLFLDCFDLIFVTFKPPASRSLAYCDCNPIRAFETFDISREPISKTSRFWMFWYKRGCNWLGAIKGMALWSRGFSRGSLFKTWPKPETAHEKPLAPRVGCLPFIKKIPGNFGREFLVGKNGTCRHHLPKISGLSRRARLDSSYNMKLVRNSRNL